jgi:hypothetical protein
LNNFKISTHDEKSEEKLTAGGKIFFWTHSHSWLQTVWMDRDSQFGTSKLTPATSTPSHPIANIPHIVAEMKEKTKQALAVWVCVIENRLITQPPKKIPPAAPVLNIISRNVVTSWS